jgi:hypothetical protein
MALFQIKKKNCFSILKNFYSSFYFTFKQRLTSTYAFCMVAPDQSARADYFKYHSVWLKKVKPVHSFLVGFKLDKKEIASINRAASGIVDINAQGVHSIAQHVPGKFINYDKVEPGDRERCAVICNQFVNEGVENIGILLPIADPEMLTTQYLHAVN